ncbi:uncharacterized protein YndB with AHSA1/START domain [Stackebrandtia albiflava]|uniref:Uncharacterized protein YndB with AHSA1/START domain n=1 Tax=Stackebrandtia albiflava TaxID=406432 RepID=A0A562VAE0_9ACTN|nr:SRPBCC domain-containing protein [Stackebrandtia albiflava]TWJ14777.1 uncharacterized protein YndB with AHSA1/START domain [Stackebrandtia albiflava]
MPEPRPEPEPHSLEKRLELDATVEEVWHAVSTGSGLSTWFVPHHVDPQDETRSTADFGSGNTSEGRVRAWDPPHRVVFGGEAGNPTETLEFLVESRDGGGTVLRLVQSGILGEDWETEYHSRGWDLFFHNLTSYLRYFAPAPAVNALAMAFTELDRKAVWDRFHTALGTSRELSTGESVNLTPDGVEPIRGVVDVYAPDTTLGIRTDTSMYRFGGHGGEAWGMVNAFHYHYGDERDGPEWTEVWQQWLGRLFPADPPS